MAKRKRSAERASSPEDLKALRLMDYLRHSWSETLLAPPMSPTSNLRLHSCYDPQLGLNPLARATIIRSVMRTEIWRDHGISDDASWQIGIQNKSHRDQLFCKDSLSMDSKEWVHVDGRHTAILYDLNWRTKLCDGFFLVHQVGGLNKWFGDRYRKHLADGKMTARLLFEARFFGIHAINNYIKFLLHGIYVPGANWELSLHPVYSQEELQRDSARNEKLEEAIVVLTQADNGGRPILTISCEENPTAGSRLATTLVAHLGTHMRSACYIPLSKARSNGELNDHGFRSIVEVIYRFVTGESVLACSPKERDEARLAMMVRQVRSHLTAVPTTFVFDGFAPGNSAYPALISFIRDEPIDRLLRLLQHPDSNDWLEKAATTEPVFRQTYFVVVGSPSRNWMEMHRRSTIDLQFTQSDEEEVLGRNNMRRLNRILGESDRHGTATHHGKSEWHLNVLSFLERKGTLVAGTDTLDTVEKSFAQYWQGLKAWQRLYLRALALSESGLRWSTSAQIFELYARLGREPRSTTMESVKSIGIGADEFRKFIDDECDTSTSAPLLFEYDDGLEADNYDIFDFPSQAIIKLTDSHPWMIARRQKNRRWRQTVDFYDVSVKHLILQATTASETIVIRRILAELCLQNYRLRLRHSRPLRRIGRRAARNIAEALLHGVMSIEAPTASPANQKEFESTSQLPALPLFTQGEIPAEPEAAFFFLYNSIFTELFCEGDPTNISRIHGNGELQLEVLLLLGRALPVTAVERALLHPERSVCIPPWWITHGRNDGLQHLLTIAVCARRAGRVEVLEAALKRIAAMHHEAPLSGLQLLTFRKLSLDGALMTHEGTWAQRITSAKLRKDALKAVFASVHADADAVEVENAPAVLLSSLRKLKRVARQYAREQLSTQISPQVLDEMVGDACDAIIKILPAHRLPKEALTLLTRMAWLEGRAGDRCQWQGDVMQAFERHFSAVLIYWLQKILALRVRKNHPGAVPHVGFSATEGYVYTVLKVKELLQRLNTGHDTQFVRRLFKTARSMMDTYIREQGMAKADHIASQVLECAFVRTFLPQTDQLAKLVRSDLPTGDERLTSLSRCLRWLRDAEQEMLSFSGQPAMRVMLCRERILCVTDMLNRVSEHFVTETRRPARRVLDDGNGEAFKPLVDIMINDFRQYGHFIGFMRLYSPAAHFVIAEWTRDRTEMLDTVKASTDLWRASMQGPYNEALHLLHKL